MRSSLVLERAGWAVVSAGTRAATGEPMHSLADEVLTENGYDTEGWRSRALTPTLVNAADLILAADRETRREIVTLEPAGLPRTFVLGQFARLASTAPPLAAHRPDVMGAELVAAVIRERLASRGSDPHDNLHDPVGQRLRQFRETLTTVEGFVRRLEIPLPPLV